MHLPLFVPSVAQFPLNIADSLSRYCEKAFPVVYWGQFLLIILSFIHKTFR